MDTRTVLLALPAVAALLLAGCVTPADEGLGAASTDAAPAEAVPEPPDVAWGEIVVNDHNHDDRSLHTDKGGLALEGFSDLTAKRKPWTSYSGYSEPDVRGDLVVVGGIEGNRAFTIADVSDPADPEVVSHFYSWGENWDARFSEGGDYVFAGCQGGTPGGAYTQASGAGACVSPDGLAPREGVANAIMAVDVSDPEDPELAGWIPSGPIHNLDTATLDDGTILVANNVGELFVFDPADGSFEEATTFEARHDVEFATHPETGQELLFTGTKELTIYDVSDPRDVELVDALDPQEIPDDVRAWHEQTPAPTMIDGRWILVGAGESSEGIPRPVTVFDITDPSDIEIKGQWELPGGPYTKQGSYKFSNHNIALTNTGQAAIGMYHAGVWVFDVSTEERMEKPVTLGAYQPHEPRLPPPMVTPYGSFANAPYVWGAQWHDSGHLVVPDMNTGLYVLEPTFGNASAVDGAFST